MNSSRRSINLLIYLHKIQHSVISCCLYLSGMLQSSAALTFPVRDCTVALGVTLHILPPEIWTLSLSTDYTGTLSIPLPDASIICCIHKTFFFFINCHAKLIYCLFVQSEKASRLSFLSGEFSAQQRLKLNFTLSSSFFFFHTDIREFKSRCGQVHKHTVLTKQHLTRQRPLGLISRSQAGSTHDPHRVAKYIPSAQPSPSSKNDVSCQLRLMGKASHCSQVKQCTHTQKKKDQQS